MSGSCRVCHKCTMLEGARRCKRLLRILRSRWSEGGSRFKLILLTVRGFRATPPTPPTPPTPQVVAKILGGWRGFLCVHRLFGKTFFTAQCYFQGPLFLKYTLRRAGCLQHSQPPTQDLDGPPALLRTSWQSFCKPLAQFAATRCQKMVPRWCKKRPLNVMKASQNRQNHPSPWKKFFPRPAVMHELQVQGLP